MRENRHKSQHSCFIADFFLPFSVHFIDYVAKDKVPWRFLSAFDDFSAFYENCLLDIEKSVIRTAGKLTQYSRKTN